MTPPTPTGPAQEPSEAEIWTGFVRLAIAALVMPSVIARGEPEDVKHNAIVALRNADALMEQFDLSSPPATAQGDTNAEME